MLLIGRVRRIGGFMWSTKRTSPVERTKGARRKSDLGGSRVGAGIYCYSFKTVLFEVGEWGSMISFWTFSLHIVVSKDLLVFN
jgi:hypothetical protein